MNAIAINENVATQLVKVENLLSDAKGKSDRVAVILANKAQTIITTLELTLIGTGLLDNNIKSKIDTLYLQAHKIVNGVYKAC